MKLYQLSVRGSMLSIFIAKMWSRNQRSMLVRWVFLVVDVVVAQLPHSLKEYFLRNTHITMSIMRAFKHIISLSLTL